MIKFPHNACNKRKHDGTIFIKDSLIEDYVQTLIKDYNPALLEMPHTFPWQDFLETYLNCEFDLVPIVPAKDGNNILGACSFYDGSKLKVYNVGKKREEDQIFNRGCIALNSYIEEQLSRLLFTALHEAGHWLLHHPYYIDDSGQFSFLEPVERIVTCCRISDIETKRNRKDLVTRKDFMEHQANVFAAAMAMPKTIILKTIKGLFEKHGYKLSKSQAEFDKQKDIVEKIEKEVASLFGVSPKAASIRLDTETFSVWYVKGFLPLFEEG